MVILVDGLLHWFLWARLVRDPGWSDSAKLVGTVLTIFFAIATPLGMILTGFTAATLISFFWSNQKEVMRRVKPYKQVIRDSHEKFDDIQARYQDGRYDAGERALLVEGLLRRVINEIESPLPADPEPEAKA